jgi:very-short-patch-repair endonuclease
MNGKIDNTMFFGASPIIFERAKLLRTAMTDAEKKIWELVCKNKLMGLRFRAQHPINRFIADFYCHPLKLVIEIDGSIHDIPENHEDDIVREIELEKFGLKIIRFTNEEVLCDFDKVKQVLINECIKCMEELQVPFRGFRGKDCKPQPG